MFNKLTAFVLSMSMVFSAVGDTLWWQVDDSTQVDGLPIITFLENNSVDDDNNWPAARIKVTYSDGTSEIVPIVYPDFPGETFYSAYVGWSLDGMDYGTGKWSTQSPLDGLNSELLTEAMFQMELGQITWDEFMEMENWITLAESDPMLKSQLDAARYIFHGGVNVPADFQWKPDFHSTQTPEPSTSVLCVIGFCVLMLKRRV